MNLIHFIAVFCLSETWSLPIQPLQNKWSGNHLNQYSLNDNSTHFNPLGISELSSESYTNCDSHEQGLAADIIKANSKPDDVDVDEIYRSSEIVETRLPVSDIQEQTTETDTTENDSTEEYTTEKVITGKDSSKKNQFIHLLEYLSLLFNQTDSNDTGLSSLEVTNDLDTENIYGTKDHSSEDSDSNRQNDPEYGTFETSKAEDSGETAATSDISIEKDHYHVAASTNTKIIVSNGNYDKNEEKSKELNSASSQVDKDDGEEKTERNENVEYSKKEETQQRFEEDNLEHSNKKKELTSHHSLDNSENIKNDLENESLVTSEEKNSNELTESRDNSEQNDGPTENEEPVYFSKKEETPKNSVEDDSTDIEEKLNSQHSAEKSDEVTTSDYESMIKENSGKSADMAKTSNTNYTREEKVQHDISVSMNVLLNEGDLGNNTKNEQSYLNDKNMNDVSKTYDLSKQDESSRPEDSNTATEHTSKTEELNSYYTSEYPKEKTDLEINSLLISESSNQLTTLDENSGNESEQENSYSELNKKNSDEVSKERDHYATAASTNVLNKTFSSENDSTNNKEDLHEEQNFPSSQDDGESKANFYSPKEETPYKTSEENSTEHDNREEELNSYKNVETSQEKDNLETANSDIHQYDHNYLTSRTSHNTENQEKDLPDANYFESSKNGYMDDTGKTEESTKGSSDLKEENSIEVVKTKDNSEKNDHYETAASTNVLTVHKGENEHKFASSQDANTNESSLKEEQTQYGSEGGYNHYGKTSHENDSTKGGENQNKCAKTQAKNNDDEEKNGSVLNSSISESEDGHFPYGTSCNDNDTTEDEDDQSTLSAGSQDENSDYEDKTREFKENIHSSNEEKTQHGSEEGYHKSSSTSIENTDDKDDQQNPSSQDENKDSKDEKIKSKENIDSLKEEKPQRSEEGDSIKHSNEKVEETTFNHFENSQEKRGAFEIHSLVTSREMNFGNNDQNDDPKSSRKNEYETPLDSSKEEQVSENSVEDNDSTDDTEGTQHRFEEESSNKNYNTNSENNNASISSEPINEGTQVHDSTDHIETEESNSNHNDGKLNVAAIIDTNDNNSEDSHSKQEMSLDVLKEDNREKEYSHAASNHELVTEMYVTENKEIISDDTDSYQITQELNTSEEIEMRSRPDERTVKENTEENKEGTSTEYTEQDFNENESLTEDETDESESTGSFSFAIPRQNYFSFTLPDWRR